MKNFKFLFAFSFFTLLTVNSCQDGLLDTAPTNSIAAADAIKSTTSASAALNGIYRAFVVRYQGSQGHSGYPAMLLILDAMGEDMVFTTTSNTWHFAEQRWISHRSDVGIMPIFGYEMYYRFISNANVILESIDGATGSTTEKARIKGEALALRAFSYYNLVQMYGKRWEAGAANSGPAVTILIKPTFDATERSTVAQVYEQINKDLTEAIALLPTARTFKSHINKNVAQGLAARVALTQERWNDAVTFATAARTGFTLMSNAQYQEGFQDIANPEWMWGFDHLEDQSEFFGGYHSYISCNFNSSVIRTCPRGISRLTYNLIPDNDVRAKMWVAAPTTTNAVTPPGGVRQPFMNQKFRLPGVPSTSTMGDTPYMRAAEMWLIEAEAKARLGDAAGAQTALHTLIANRDITAVKTTKTGTALLDEIWFNRRIEFWGEGHRFFDLKRLNQPVDRRNSNHNTAVAVEMLIPAGDIRWEFLIPRAELNSNPKAIQNPL
jgi:starch-binding outer membrane protein, SusD/RagB family